MVEAYGLFGYCALIALGLSLALMILICLCTTLITWLLLISVALILMAFGALLIVEIYYPGQLNDGINTLSVNYLSFIWKETAVLTVLAVVAILMGFVFIFIFIKFRKYINHGIPIIRIAFRSTFKNILLIFLCIFIVAL
jgi:hypothetical protein